MLLMDHRKIIQLRTQPLQTSENTSNILFLLNTEREAGTICLILSALFIFMSSPYFPWSWLCAKLEIIDATIGNIQFSWRLLTIAVLAVSIVLTISVCALIRRQSLTSVVLAGVLIMMVISSGVDAGTEYYSSGSIFMEDKFDNSTMTYTDYVLSSADMDGISDWLTSGKGPAVWDENDAFLEEDRLVVTDYLRNGTDYRFTFVNTAEEDVIITIPVLWYGMHTAYLMSEEGECIMELVSSMNGSLQFTDVVIPGEISEGTVELVYESPTIFRAAEAVSLLTLVFLLTLVIRKLLAGNKQRVISG